MTDVLLVATNREMGPMPVLPIGVCQVASAVARAGIPCRVVDLCFAADPVEALCQAVAQERPRLVGLGIRNIDNCDYHQPLYYLPYIQDLVSALRRVTDVPLVIGGTGTSLAPRMVLGEVGADLAVAGPGGRAFVDLYRRLVEDGERLEDQPQVTYGGHKDGEETPGPQFAHWLDLKPYKRLAVPVTVQSRRGCPLRCVYCEYAHIEGGTPYLLRDINAVVGEIDRAVRTTGSRVVEFVDSTFNSPPRYSIELCEALARSGAARAYHASGINPRFGQREVLEAMREAGFTAVYCSPDAAAPKTLEGYRKDFSVEQLAQMTQDTRELRLAVLWSFILGGPGETPETARETLRFIREEIDPFHTVMVTPRMRIYPGTALEQLARKEGYPPVELDLRKPRQFYRSEGITDEELNALLREALTTIGNVMSISTAQVKLTYWLQRLNAITGYTKPNWKSYPPIRYWMRRVGVPWA